MKTKKIAILYGGLSKEREVSIKTGEAVYEVLKKAKYKNAYLLDVNKNIVSRLLKDKPDLCFIALHGNYGEDGKIQSLLEMLDIPYTGSKVEASAISFDKVISKQILSYHKIPTADFYLPFQEENEEIFPCVVKPAREGSTIGITIVKEKKYFKEALKEAYKFDKKVLVERFIEGKELTVSILNSKVLPIIWIKPKKGFYDYESKYTKGMTEYIFETGLTEKETEMINQIALKTYKIMDCEGASRIDFIYDGNTAWVLEINTLPGLTETSLLPKAANQAGISFLELIEELLKGALNR